VPFALLKKSLLPKSVLSNFFRCNTPLLFSQTTKSQLFNSPSPRNGQEVGVSGQVSPLISSIVPSVGADVARADDWIFVVSTETTVPPDKVGVIFPAISRFVAPDVCFHIAPSNIQEDNTGVVLSELAVTSLSSHFFSNQETVLALTANT
jgi:hypothetical protein